MKNQKSNFLVSQCLSAIVPAKRAAFTLAEVLITLAIIGVVATMTIPTLIANYQERSWNTAAKVFDRKLTESLRVMNAQSTLAGHKTTESFVNELGKHLKFSKICDNSNLESCFENKVLWGLGTSEPDEVDITKIQTSKNIGQGDWNTNMVGVQLANGTNALIAYNPTDTCTQDPYSNQIDGSNCLAILYDTSGFKSPNTNGKDVRANQNVKFLGCALKLDGTCYTTTPFVPGAHVWNACTGTTSTDPEDLKIMDDYGISSCIKNADHWAGAVIACGGIKKMPTKDDLQKLALYLYPTRESENTNGGIICPKDSENKTISCRDKDRFEQMGITTNSVGTFWLWSNSEGNGSAFSMGYASNGADWTNFWSRIQPAPFNAICVDR